MYGINFLVLITMIAIIIGSLHWHPIEHFENELSDSQSKLLDHLETSDPSDPQSKLSDPSETQKPKIAVACLMRKPVDLPLWLDHHRKLGITKFYIRLEDSPGWKDYLDVQSDVSYITAESDKTGNNYETLQSRQIEYVNKCLKNANDEGISWLFHIDADELLHGKLQFLNDIDDKYMCVKLENAEAVFEDGKQDSCFDATKFLKCSAEGSQCKSYVNGKAGGRVHDDVKLAGPHDFSYNGKIDGDHLYKVPFNVLHVLHYDSCSFGSWSEKFLNLGKNKKDNIPFSYYTDSIDAAKEAYDVYKRYKMIDTDKLDKSMLYYLE